MFSYVTRHDKYEHTTDRLQISENHTPCPILKKAYKHNPFFKLEHYRQKRISYTFNLPRFILIFFNIFFYIIINHFPIPHNYLIHSFCFLYLHIALKKYIFKYFLCNFSPTSILTTRTSIFCVDCPALLVYYINKISCGTKEG